MAQQHDLLVRFQFEDGDLVQCNNIAPTYDDESGEHLASYLIAQDIDGEPEQTVNYTEIAPHRCKGELKEFAVAYGIEPLAMPLVGVSFDMHDVITVYAVILTQTK